MSENDCTIGESGLHIADEQFVHEWMTNGYKVPEAYMAIWPDASKRVAGVKGSAKLKEPMIVAYVAGVVKQHLDKYDATEDNIIGELASIAFLDIVDIVDKNGVVIDLNKMPEKARRAVASVSENIEGRVTVKFCNKEKALELLAKYRKLLTDVHEISTDKDLAAAILGARQRTGVDVTIKDLLG